jgi:heme A synthase
MRTLVELMHLLVGLAVAAMLMTAAAWAYPIGREVFWWCGAAAMTVTVLMGIGPLRRAWAKDRGRF